MCYGGITPTARIKRATHTKYFKTIEEAIKYRDEYFASGCTLENIKRELKSGYKYIRQTKSNTYEFRHQKTNHTKSFKSLNEVIKYRDNYLLNLGKT